MRKPGESTRRLRIVDLMALTAAMAIGIAIARLLDFAEPFSRHQQPWSFLESSWAFLLPFPWFLSASWLIERRRIGAAAVLDPGSAASIATTVCSICLFVSSIHLALRLSALGRWTHGDLWADVMIYLIDPRAYAAAVIVSWLVLRLDGRWVASISLLDRFGRLLGCYWILSAVAMLVINIWNNWRL